MPNATKTLIAVILLRISDRHIIRTEFARASQPAHDSSWRKRGNVEWILKSFAHNFCRIVRFVSRLHYKCSVHSVYTHKSTNLHTNIQGSYVQQSDVTMVVFCLTTGRWRGVQFKQFPPLIRLSFLTWTCFCTTFKLVVRISSILMH